jgi:transposase
MSDYEKTIIVIVGCWPDQKRSDFFDRYIRDIAAQRTEYVVKRIAEEFGIIILRLPPYHCFFNPIEFAWGYIKNEVAKQNMNEKKTLETVRELLQ